ncbi:MAG: anaerobic ribonucleoside-triphosphate reductase activating protein [Desulfobacteraceae bacterium]|nr:anaerobic ribonucleoside-triphosphate reductase activating protein [Desulfobacteraceae bacterium]
MKLGGLQKHTLIDFPGHLACTIFTFGCNFRCPYCHNPELVLPSYSENTQENISKTDIYSFLETRKGLLDGVAITGGEPCLQTDLINFCHDIKKMGFKIKLDTNGTFPKILEQLFDEKLVDYVAMDIKSNLQIYSTAAGKYVNLNAIKKSINLIMEKSNEVGFNYEFRTTCVKSLMDEKIIKDIGEMIKGAEKYILQLCNSSADVLNPDFLKKQDSFFSEKELLYLKSIVETYVNKCEIR